MSAPNAPSRDLAGSVAAQMRFKRQVACLVASDVEIGVCNAAELVGGRRRLRELGDLSPSASAKRRLDFAIGRIAARRALHALAADVEAIPIDVDGRPRWPAGIVGSIAHSEGLAVASAACGKRLRGHGIDMEPLSRHIGPQAEKWILTEKERCWIGEAEAVHWPLILFCAKEATYKAFSAVADLGFQDVSFRNVAPGVLKGSLHVARALRGEVVARYALIEGFALSSVEFVAATEAHVPRGV